MIDQARLAESLAQLDAGTRALLDLSLRRAIPDEQVAKVLGVEPASIPPRRARGIAQLADMMEVPGPSELAALLIAIPDLPEEAWGVPVPAPFAGAVSRARRAKAFRRVAVAASPLVALGAVMAAVLVSSSDHSGGGSGSGGAQRGGAGAPATASAPQARHGLPPGASLTQAPHRGAGHRGAHHGARRHHRAHRAGGAAEPAVLARGPVHAAPAPQSTPVAFQPAPVVRHAPRHVTHHPAPVKPKLHVPAPAPAPVQTPSQPVSNPAPSVPASPPVQVSAPVTQTVQSAPTPNKPYKPPPPQPDLSGPSHDGGDDGDGHSGCQHRGGDDGSSGASNGHGWHHGNSQPAAQQNGGGKPWSPPGLFRRHHGH